MVVTGRQFNEAMEQINGILNKLDGRIVELELAATVKLKIADTATPAKPATRKKVVKKT